MDQHYLKNLSNEVLLANAGYNAKEWSEYKIPRSRGTSINDNETKILVEFFFADLYNMQERARVAHAGRPQIRSDPNSVTNFEFLTMLREITFFWLQDCVVLLSEQKELQNVAPFSTLLQGCIAEPRVREAFDWFSKQVRDAVEDVRDRQLTELLNQTELQNALANGVQRTVNLLSNRLSHLPEQMLFHAEKIAERRNSDMMACVKKAFDKTMQDMAHRMFDVRTVKEATHAPQQATHAPRRHPPSGGSSPIPEVFSGDEGTDEDAIHLGAEHVTLQSSGEAGAIYLDNSGIE